MKKFNYTAKNENGDFVSGEIDTINESSAAKILITKKLYPIEIKDIEKGELSFEKVPFFKGVSRKKKAVAIRQLATLINAGLPITQSLETMAKESTDTKLKDVFNDVLHEVEGGSSLAQAFSKHPEIFSNLDISLVTAGEKSGTLDKVLKRMATQMEKETQLISKVRGAMVYPAIILVVVVGVVVLMLVYVLPKLTVLYQDFKGQLPIATRIMIMISDFLKNFWWGIALALVSFVWGARYFIKTPSGRKVWDLTKLKIPGFKILLMKIYLARFTRTLGTLVGSGVSVLDSLKITADSVGNVIYKEDVLKTSSEIRGGGSLSNSLANSKLFPSVVAQMIRVGEQTGEIDNMLDSLANYYEEEVDNAIKSLSTLIEPFIIIFMGLVVGGILIAIMTPIYNISQVIFKK